MEHSAPTSWDKRLADWLCAAFAVVILFYAAGGAISDLVRWLIETTTAGFEDMSRRDQRVLMREHWLGASWRLVERNVLQPTGLILGLPIVFGLVISALTLPHAKDRPWLNLGLALAAFGTMAIWIVGIFATDAGLLPSADAIDFVVFPVAAGVTLYLTWRMFGGFIAGFCLFWVLYLFVRGWLPDWAGIFQGSNATAYQNLLAMVQNFWAQTGGMFGQPIQVVAGNVLIFIVFGAVLMNSGAGELLMKLANRLTGRFTGGAAHASVASSALFGTLSGAAISNVVSTGVMTIPVIKKAGFRPAFAGAVEAAASTGGQVMPPVMGVVAFFVAGQIGLEYRYIVVAAILPAFFYYSGLHGGLFRGAPRGRGRAARGAATVADPQRVSPVPGLHHPAGRALDLPVHPALGAQGRVLRVPGGALAALALFPEFRSRRGSGGPSWGRGACRPPSWSSWRPSA
jgi:TRAP-type uncharacterized transport system fused permease subunit